MTLKEILEARREEIIDGWVHLLHTGVSERYSERSLEELLATVSAAFEAYFDVLTGDDFVKMDALIERIGLLRLTGGFLLSEVQKAFELYRTVTLPVLRREMEPGELFAAVEKINDCLSSTITRFSDHFQSLQEKEIRDHASNLECIVADRTRELAESEGKYRMLVEDINDGYFVHKGGVVVFANKAFCDMHGYTRKEVIGKPFLSFVAPGSRAELQGLYDERIHKGGGKDQYIYLRLCKDGGQPYTENKVKLIDYEGGTATAGICRDITERMEVEKQRFRLAQLESERKAIALETLHQLMVTLSHYLLNANAIIGGMVRRSERADSEVQRLASLQEIKEQAKKMEMVIEALKRVTEIKTADYSFESHVLMIDVQKEIERNLSKAGRAKGVKRGSRH